ncbi:hypothetical protein ACFL3G_01215 [Planctomycetota bacterium]
MAEFKDRLRFLVIDNTNGQDKEIHKLREDGFETEIVNNDTQGKKGSYGHACGLNVAMSIIKTKYALITDPDVYVFKNKWDSFLIELISSERIAAVGTSFPEWQLGKYHDFPNPVFCFFRTYEYMQLEPDWTPFGANRLVKCWDFFRRNVLRLGIIINRRVYEKHKPIRVIWSRLEKIIGICSRDTGWRIAKKARENKIKGEVFKATLPSEKIEGDETGILNQFASEFEVYCYENEPILTHKYSTCSRLWRTERSRETDYWLSCIEKTKDSITKGDKV